MIRNPEHAAGTSEGHPADVVSCISLLVSFLRIGAVAFGGGYAILPLIEAEVSRRRGWFTTHEIAEAYALGQSVPGVIAINTAAFLGGRLRGSRGALAAALGTALPAFLIILLVAMVMPGLREWRWAGYALWGVRPAVVAIIARAAWRMARFSPLSWPTAAAFGAALVLMVFTEINPIVPIAAAAVAGIALAALAPRSAARLLAREKGNA